MFDKLQSKYTTSCQAIACQSTDQSSHYVQLGLFFAGVALLTGGMVLGADAQGYSPRANYNDDRIAESADVVLTYLNGSFGALVMVASGIGAIIAGAFGQYRAALGLMVVAIGSFIIRSLVSTWFNDQSLLVN